MLSQNNSQEDISRSDSNYQGLVHVINQSQSQSATLLYPMYQSQGYFICCLIIVELYQN